MLRFLTGATVVCLLLGQAGRVLAEDTAQGIIDKAIQAHGGAEKLAKFKAVQTSGKGTIEVMGMTLSFTAEGAAQMPDKFKSVLNLEVAGMKVTQVQAMNGDKITITVNGKETPINDDIRKLVKDQVYAESLTSLLPLKEKSLELSLVGEAKVDGQAAVGVKVTSKGHPDVTLYFDKKTDLLAKAGYRTRDPGSNQDYNQEKLFRDYKDVNGIKTPMKETIQKDGQKFIEVETLEVKYLEKLDDSAFEP
jgi:hypothetical protein